MPAKEKNHFGLFQNSIESKVYPDRLNTTIFHKTTIAYDYSTGAVISQTDPNGKITTTDYRNHSLTTSLASPVNDPFLRPELVIDPTGRKASTFYHDSLRQVETKADLKIPDDALLKTMATHDKLGRVTKVESSEDGTSYSISSQTSYKNDSVSKVSITKTSNPTRGDGAPTDGWTRTTKDDLGRVIEVATFSGSAQPPDTGCAANCTGAVTTSYISEYTTVTDQAGKQRRSRVDALGRLVRVDEPTTAGLGTFDSPNQKTENSYDSRGNLTLVTQGTQTRTFTYDKLNRLTQAKNPEQVNEQGQQVAAIYDYDNASNLTLRTNPNGSTVGFSYDGLNRAQTKTLTVTGSPTIWNYNYDTATNGKGRLASVVLNGGTDGYYYDSYDASGRVTASRQITSASGVAQAYSMGYAYDVSGNMTSETYPSGKVIETEYDAAGRIAGVKRQANGMYYAGGSVGSGAMQYAAHGAVTSMRLGNGRIERTTFNNRLQPVQISLDSNTVGVNTLQLDYGYGTTTNNGNVLSQAITVPKPASGNLVLTQNYSYDALNRLSTAEELITTTSQWKQTYDIDRWGNRAVRSTSSYIPTPVLTPQSANSTDFSAFNQGNNRIARTGFGYDVAGNLTGDPTTNANAMVYDGENRQTSYTKAGATTSYSYDGDGRRVKKNVGNDTTVFVYNVAGQLIAEYTSGTPAAGDTSYLTTDHLGSTRLVTDSGGNVKARYDYLPFGEEIGANIGSRSLVGGYGGTDSTKQKFTQKERDSESGLDYFLARYYSSAQGRFTSPDPGPYSLQHPQVWNRYAYTANDPVNCIDPDGEFSWGASLGGNLTDEQLRERARNATNLGAAFQNLAIISQRNSFRAVLKGLEEIAARFGTESEKGNRVKAARDAYGDENKVNGVTVARNDSIKGGGETQSKGQGAKLTSLISFKTSSLADAKFLVGAVGHEGQHILNNRRGLSALENEISAYTVESFIFEKQGFAFFDRSYTGLPTVHGVLLFNPNWLYEGNEAALRRSAILQMLRSNPLYQKLFKKRGK